MGIFSTYQSMPSQAAQATLGARTQALPGQAQDVNKFLQMFQQYAPQGIQSQSPGMAQGAAQQLMGGQSLEEKVAARNSMRNRFNTALGQIAGSGATGADFLGRARTEAMPGLVQGEQQMAADEARRRQEGAGQVFGGLSSSLLGPDPLAEAFGRELGNLQQFGVQDPYMGTRAQSVNSGVPGSLGYQSRYLR